MHANNEVGTINPIADLVKAAKNVIVWYCLTVTLIMTGIM